MKYYSNEHMQHRNWKEEIRRSKDYANSGVTVRPIDEEALKKFEDFKPDINKSKWTVRG